MSETTITFELSEIPDDTMGGGNTIMPEMRTTLEYGVGLSDLKTHMDVDKYNGFISAALELIFAAPAFDNLDSDEIEVALGSGIHVRMETDFSIPELTTIYATSPSYDPREGLSRSNFPLNGGDIVPHSEHGFVKMVDWPTDGPQFELADQPEEFKYAQIEDPRETLEFLSAPDSTERNLCSVGEFHRCFECSNEVHYDDATYDERSPGSYFILCPDCSVDVGTDGGQSDE